MTDDCVGHRPEPEQPGKIHFSDTTIDKGTFDGMFAGFQHRFSGNPQPTLPHTVGHIMTATA
jgi:hypothetical protein